MSHTIRSLATLFVSVLALCVLVGLAKADAVFKDAEDVHGIYSRLVVALDNLDAVKFAAEFTDDGNASVWGTKGEEILGKERAAGAIGALMAARQKGEFSAKPLRLHLDGNKAWGMFEWSWGPEWKGNAIGLLQKEAAGWRVRSVDFYSNRLKTPVEQFNPTEAVKRMQDLFTLIQPAAQAMAQGNLNGLAAAGHSEFRFVDRKNVPYFDAEGLGALGQETAVRSLSPDKMTLFLNVRNSQAIVWQDIEGLRVSALLKVENGQWKIHTVSMSPLDALSVTAKARVATTWARLRRG